MPKKDQNLLRTLFSTAIFIVMEIAALHFLFNSGEVQQSWLGGLTRNFQAFVWGKTEGIKHYFSLDEQNRILSEENMQLRAALGLRADGDALAQLDTLFEQLPDARFSFISARVVKLSDNRTHNYLIIDRGEADGVAPGDGIVTSCGVIGIVEATGRHSAYAITMKNPQMSLSARLGTEGISGPLSWDGRTAGGAVLRDIPLQTRFAPGDTVYTSSHSSIFPTGIPIGVTGESKIVNGATYEIRVSLFQEYSTLQYVSVAKNLGKDEIQEFETGGQKR